MLFSRRSNNPSPLPRLPHVWPATRGNYTTTMATNGISSAGAQRAAARPQTPSVQRKPAQKTGPNLKLSQPGQKIALQNPALLQKANSTQKSQPPSPVRQNHAKASTSVLNNTSHSSTPSSNSTPNTPTTPSTSTQASPEVSQSQSRAPNSLLNVWCLTLFIKCLLFVGYHSTDFEVHRNWLAVTHNLPVAQWYTDATSQWTLDYPPFFAYFEWALSYLVPPMVRADGCLDLVREGSYGLPTILFQRLSVVVTELVLLAALQWYIDTSDSLERSQAFVIALSLILSPGLFIIDHIHFQYNGMMYGLLVLMINSARLKKYLWCGFWFSVLLCFKHIYLYLAPAVFIFLLRAYTLDLKYDTKKGFLPNAIALVKWGNLSKLATVVITVFAAAFGPFVYYGKIPNLLERLFPFSRGLTHAYWAPNVWAVYSFLDRVLIQVYKQIPIAKVPLQKVLKFNPILLANPKLLNSTTRGIVGDIEFLVLPTITPKLTFLLTLFYQIMALIPLFLQPNFERFIGALTLCGYASFLFGWHVHEKAILLVIFPMSFLVTRDKRLLSSFNLLAACGYVSLFPLIFKCEEWLVKVAYTALWYLIYYVVFRKVVRISKSQNSDPGSFLLERATSLYILGLVPLTLMATFIDLFDNQFEIFKQLEFMKLMMMSVYCGIGIICSWNGFNWLYFVDETIWDS